MPGDVVETPGAGVSGLVDGRRVAVGTAEYCAGDGGLPRWARDIRRRAAIEGSTCAFVRVDDDVRGALVLDDPLRSETPRAIRSLRRIGFTRIVMVTGDNAAVADIIGSAIGVDAVLADRVPAEKVDAVRVERSTASGPIVMVGDGLNDAPALALADVGVAMGARGASASSEAADIVITVDRLDRLTEAVQIARRARSIAVQSVVLGMGMSIVAMAAAALGFLPVVAGAILQEAIDVAVILNALRALRGGVEVPAGIPGWTETSARLHAAHLELEPSIARIRATADVLDGMPAAAASAALEEIRRFVSDDLLPHEELEDRTIYPMLASGDGLRRRDRVDASDAPGDLPTRASARSPGPRPPVGRARAAMTGRICSASCTAWKRSFACIRRRRRTCTARSATAAGRPNDRPWLARRSGPEPTARRSGHLGDAALAPVDRPNLDRLADSLEGQRARLGELEAGVPGLLEDVAGDEDLLARGGGADARGDVHPRPL